MENNQWTKWKKDNKEKNFQVRVHVIECRDLQPRDRNGMSDPLCVVRVHNKKENTITVNDTTTCTWDHLMFMEFKMLAEEFFMGKINVSVMDANTVLRNVEIGSYEFDVAQVYDMQNHELYRKWVALTDKSGKFPGVQGYLKLSVTVLGPDESAPIHDEKEEEDEEGEGEDLQSLVLLPPSIKTEEHCLEINVFRGEGLPKMDAFTGKCDGFVVAKFGGSKEVKTEAIKNTYTPTWNERLSIPLTLPTLSDTIKVTLKDWDKAAADETIATVFLKYSEITNGPTKWGEARWVNFYGTPEDVNLVNNKPAAKMNDGFIEGTSFRGRVLMSATSKMQPGAKLQAAKINSQTEPPQSNYILRCDLFEASELSFDGSVSIEVSVGKMSKDSSKADVKNGHASWFTSFEDMGLTMPSDATQVPDIFVTVYKSGITGKKRVGYIRFKASELNGDVSPKWHHIQRDPFGDTEKGQAVGFLQLGLAFATQTSMAKKVAIAKPNYKKYTLRAHLYQAKELMAADDNAASDPYAVVRIGRYSAKTKIVKATLFPLWYETLNIEVQLPEGLVNAADVTVSVYDWDQLTKDDFLGRFSVPVGKISEKFQDLPVWYDLSTTSVDVKEGAVLASFQLIPEANVSKYPIPKITPEFKDCTLEISAIGLRSLLPVALLPVQNAYIEFDCGGTERIKTKTSTKPSPKNPNHLEVLTLPVKIPVNPLFAPPINIRCFDDRVIHRPLIGSRSLSSASFIPWVHHEPIQDEAQTPEVKVDEIPGAKMIAPEAPQPTNTTSEEQISLEIQEEADKLDLLKETQPKIKELSDALKTMGERDIPEVAESVPEGVAPDEPEETGPKREEVKSELERKFTEIPFGIYKIFRAKKETFSINGQSVLIPAGEFKGQFKIVEKGQKTESPNLSAMYAPATYVVRAYIIEGYQLVPKDPRGSNNPYLRLNCGKNKIKDIETAKQNTSRPTFYKGYEMRVEFPQETNLEISVWDYNKIQDELIGSTKIDLENRFFSKEWKAVDLKPYEYRSLWNPTSKAAQGALKMWIEILTEKEARDKPMENIAPPPPIDYELRVIIWDTKDVVFKDEKMSDIFCSCYPEGQEPQVTDTHWRSEDHTGIFNWRMKFPIKLPADYRVPKLKLQIWDKDILNPNDAICEANLNLRSFYKKTYNTKSNRESIAKQYVAMTHPSASGVQGQMNVSIELMTLEESRKYPAGFGRGEPNSNPFLEEPPRPASSFAPWRLDKYVSELGWKKYKWYIIGALVCIVIILIIIIVLGAKVYL